MDLLEFIITAIKFIFGLSLLLFMVVIIYTFFIEDVDDKKDNTAENINRPDTRNFSPDEKDLINSCYENPFGFNLKKLHKKLSNPLRKGRKALTIQSLDIDGKGIGFQDSISSSFELVRYNDKHYLLGDSTCYPCSRVWKNNKGRKWLDVIAVPKGDEIIIRNDKNDIIKHGSYETRLNKLITTKKTLNNYFENYISTFKNNDWFSHNSVVFLIKDSSVRAKSIYKVLRNKNLLNPFQLATFSIYLDFNIGNEELYNTIAINDITFGIDYITRVSRYKLQFAESTEALIDSKKFKKFIQSLNQEQIDSFFEVEYLYNTLSLKKYDLEFIKDILSINDSKRFRKSNHKSKLKDYKKDKLSKFNITRDVIQTYYKRLSQNLRSLENKIRSKQGFNIVGSLYNESLLYNKLKNNFPNLTIISQHSPDWLGRQRFDIFIEELDMAIEYNGRQHYEPIDFFGGEEGLNETRERDERKRKKCKKNDCTLLEVKYDENLDNLIEKVESIVGTT